MEIPANFKPLTQYIRRAEELDKDANPNSEAIAHYCRMYALDKGMKMGLPQSEMSFLYELMGLVESKPYSKIATSATGKQICEDFALGVFRVADDEDRNSGSTMSTAKGFYNAAAFFDIIEQFGELEPDVSSYSDLAHKRMAVSVVYFVDS
jgi:vacuolar protein sorting-associated protein VTA1